MSAHFAVTQLSGKTVEAISTFYHPRFHDDHLPSHPKDFAQLTQRNWTLLQGFLHLAKSQLEIRSIWSERAVGIVRILIEGEINTSLSENITIALSNFETNLDQNQTRKLIMQFIFERFKSYLLEKT